MWSRRLKETFAVITVGNGMIESLAPKQHFLLSSGSGVWLASRQYREE